MKFRLVAVAIAFSALPAFASQASFERNLTVNGRVDLAVFTGSGNVHISRGSIDVAINTEGQLDVARPHAAGRSHVVHIGNRPEVALERRRHGAGHNLRARTRQGRLRSVRGDLPGGHAGRGAEGPRHADHR